MPRYYFHTRRGRVTVLDHNGAQLPDLEEAAKEAARRGREIASAEPGSAIVVADEQMSPILEIPIPEAED